MANIASPLDNGRAVDLGRLIQGRTGPREILIGPEVHAQVASNTRLFSGARG